jgi:adenylate cyclase class IV
MASNKRQNNVESNLEVEYKFWAGTLTKESFQSRIENFVNKQMEPFYVCSCDDYYTKEDSKSFLRYRKGDSGKELTLKVKKGSTNTVRKEINLNLSGNDDSSVVEFLILNGYKKTFSIFKEAWIWRLDKCDVSYYTLSDGRSVIEIEATECQSADEATEVIDKWSDHLNMQSSVREKRSLFEIFTEEKNGR